MEILTRERLNQKMWKAYDNEPRGWKYFFGKDKKGNYNVIIANRILGEQYWMKFTSPYGKDHIFVGIRAGIEDEDISRLKSSFFDVDFGVRPLNLTQKDLINLLKGKEGAIEKQINEEKRAMKKPPIPREEAEKCTASLTSMYQCVSPKKLEDISAGQNELNKKMEKELKRLERMSFNYVC